MKLAATRKLLALAAITLTLGIGGTALAQQKPIVIGGTLGLTGNFAEPSTDYKAVYDRWLEQVNKKGGLLGRPVKMTIYNDESTPTVAQSLYSRLLDQDHVDLVLAPYTTFIGGAIVPIVLSHQKLLFNGGFVGINIFKNAKGSVIGSYTYQEPDYTRGLFDLIKGLPGDKRPKRVAIFTAQNPFTDRGTRRRRRGGRRAQFRQSRRHERGGERAISAQHHRLHWSGAKGQGGQCRHAA